MINFVSTLLEGNGELAPDFWTTFLPILRYILFGIIVVCAIVMIITTLMQANDSNNGLDAFTGNSQESYYSQNKGASRDAILKRITISMAVIIFVCIIIFFVTEIFISK